MQVPELTSFQVLTKLCPAEIWLSSGMVTSIGLPAAAWLHNTWGVGLRVGSPPGEVVRGDGIALEGVIVGLSVGDGVPLRAVAVTWLVGCEVSTAAIVWYTWVRLGVGVLRGSLLVEIRLISCHNKKIIPAATSNHTKTVSRLKRIGVPFLVDI